MSRSNKTRIHALHIGKTAGTQLAFAIKAFNKTSKTHTIKRHGHGVVIADLDEGEDYFFSLRDPISRFYSAFYGRKRQDMPRHNAPWQPREAAAFARFEHANELAEALFEDTPKGGDACFAMLNIGHLWRDQKDWARGMGDLLSNRPPFTIIRQSHFEDDLRALFSKLDPSAEFRLADDAIAAHKNDYSDCPPLSEKARKNLEHWYAQDYEFYRIMLEWRERRAS